jgi:hypothetical protein
MMKEKFRIFEKLFNQKLRVLETAYDNLILEINNLQIDNKVVKSLLIGRCGTVQSIRPGFSYVPLRKVVKKMRFVPGAR